MSAIDAFALSMLTVVFLSFGMIGLLFLNMARRASRRDLELEQLIQEVATKSEDSTSIRPNNQSTEESWEREVDWWKKSQ